ncbi:MAG: bifunctional alpha,alpha-trehalose-phosphate synthase (UDP-forming)/trehalose-phosphatase [Spirochaetes bacterium]|nr:bifunctional alpha,alpha-trehalose-phosphate synthase (UDP-forming)/trehalose-phosphatase [Spirochaetota bacterium]
MKLIVVSNRLPFEIGEEQGRLVVRQTAGGVATGFHAYIAARISLDPDFSYCWAGWPGPVPEERWSELLAQAGPHYAPVALSVDQMEKFYDGFCNRTLWPLLHSFPMLTEYDDEFWRLYDEVNRLYCEKIAEIAGEDDIIFVNDYHLMLLPRLLRARLPRIKIVFFLHTPFPHFGIFRLLPGVWRHEILHGLLAADVTGFHTNEYREHFLHAVRRILGFEHRMGEITFAERTCKAEAFPMGIDFDLYAGTESSASLTVQAKPLRRILSIDRLDYTKGVIGRLHGFVRFLEKYPEMCGRVQLCVVAVPSRIGVGKYQDLKTQLDELIGKINGQYSRLDWLPVFYRYTMLPTREVIALYRECDIALVTPLRDGMNLIAKEYLAARYDDTGVLILSEMAGAAGELPGALQVNPNSASEIADAIKLALDLSPEEQVRRNRPMRAYIRSQDIHTWMREIMDCLEEKIRLNQQEAKVHLSGEARRRLLAEFAGASRRAIFLDYDGTLAPFHPMPESALLDSATKADIVRLATLPHTDLYVVSGRNRDFLSAQFDNTAIGLIAEHGVFLRRIGQPEWQTPMQGDDAWIDSVLPIMERFRRRVYGSFIERKERTVVFHYRNAFGETELIRERALELYDVLVRMLSNSNLEILFGQAMVEVRHYGFHKGMAVKAILAGAAYDFALAVGDDVTDEDMFRAIPREFSAVKVGFGASVAPFFLRDPNEVHELLRNLKRD